MAAHLSMSARQRPVSTLNSQTHASAELLLISPIWERSIA
jgi:hypothetical protein